MMVSNTSLPSFVRAVVAFGLLLLSKTFIRECSGFGFTRLSTTTKQMNKIPSPSFFVVPSTSTSALYMGGFFDFNPFSGGGSGTNDDFKEEQWEAQQAILRARQNAGLTKEQLKSKYKKQIQLDDDVDETKYTEPTKATTTATASAASSTTPSVPSFFANVVSTPPPAKAEPAASQPKKAEPAAPSLPQFDLPKFEVPKLPKMPWDK